MKYGYINQEGFLIDEHVKDKTIKSINMLGKSVDLTISPEEQIEKLIVKGYKPVEEKDESKMYIEGEELYFNYPVPYDAGAKIKYRYEKNFNFFTAQHKIQELKDELSSTDHKVFKAHEASLSGKSSKSILSDALVKKRQALRDEINELQSLINNEEEKHAKELGFNPKDMILQASQQDHLLILPF